MEPPFLAGPISTDLEKIRAKQATAYFLGELHADPSFQRLICGRRKTLKKSGAWQLALNTMYFLVIGVLLLMALQHQLVIDQAPSFSSPGTSSVASQQDSSWHSAPEYGNPVLTKQLAPPVRQPNVIGAADVVTDPLVAVAAPAFPREIKDVPALLLSPGATSGVNTCSTSYLPQEPYVLTPDDIDNAVTVPLPNSDRLTQDANFSPPADSGSIDPFPSGATLSDRVQTAFFAVVGLLLVAASASMAVHLLTELLQQAFVSTQKSNDKAVHVSPCPAAAKPVGTMASQTPSLSTVVSAKRYDVQRMSKPTHSLASPTLERPGLAIDKMVSASSTLKRPLEVKSDLFSASMLDTAASNVKPPGVDASLERLRSPTPMAVNMLTPTEPPSPVLGFPHFTKKVCESPLSLPGLQLAASEAVPDSKSASWGSRSGDSGNDNADASTARLGREEITAASHHTVAASSTANAPIFDLDRFDDDGEELDPAVDVLSSSKAIRASMNPARLNGEKTIASGSQRRLSSDDIPLVSDVRRSDTASSFGGASSLSLENHDPLGAFASASVQKVLFAPTPTWPPAAARDVPNLDSRVNETVDILIAEEARSLAESLVSQALENASPIGSMYDIYSEAVQQLRFGVGGSRTMSGAAPQGPLGDPWSAIAGTDPSRSSSLAERIQEPGRAYASVAATAQLLFQDIRQHGKAVCLAASSEDRSSLLSSQQSLSAALERLQGMELAPRAHTSLTRACKALAFAAATPIATPVAWQETPRYSEGCGGDLASIGSRVVSGSHDSDGQMGQKQHEPSSLSPMIQDSGLTGRSALTPGVMLSSEAESAVTIRSMSASDPGSGLGTGSVGFRLFTRNWSQGAPPLEADTGAYLVGGNSSATPVEWVLNGYLSSLTQLGLLVASMGTTIYDMSAEINALRRQLGKESNQDGSGDACMAFEQPALDVEQVLPDSAI